MIDLTPLEIRNKRGEFKKVVRGYEPRDVDAFLEIAAERLEMLVRENLQLRERNQVLQDQVEIQVGREQAVQEALVTAQALRADIQSQSQRQAETVLREADGEARRIVAAAESDVRTRMHDVERQLEQANDSIRELERRRARFLVEFRSLLQREMDVVDVEAGRAPFEARTIELDLGQRSRAPREATGPSWPDVSDAEADPESQESSPPHGEAALPADLGAEPVWLDGEGLSPPSEGPRGERERFPDVPDLESLLAGSGEELGPSTPRNVGPSRVDEAYGGDVLAEDSGAPDRMS
jgi:cell division initiation protein